MKTIQIPETQEDCEKMGEGLGCEKCGCTWRGIKCPDFDEE